MNFTQLFADKKVNFPVVGDSSSLYYAIDEHTLYQWTGAYSVIANIENCIQVDTIDDLPRPGIIGLLYFIKNESKYALYIGDNGGWDLISDKWQYSEIPPVTIGLGDPTVYCLDYEMNLIRLNLYELIPSRVRIFTSPTTFSDVVIKDSYMAHRGNVDNIPQIPATKPFGNTKLSLQSVLGKTPEQAKSVAVLNIYNYMYKPKGLNGYILINGSGSGGGGGTGSGDYEELNNKPTINGVTLVGDLRAADLNLYTKTEIDALVKDINGVLCLERAKFPIPGRTNCLYIATDTLIAYIFDTAKNVYIPISGSGGGSGSEAECKVVVTSTGTRPPVGQAGIIYYMLDTQKLMYFDNMYREFVPTNFDYNSLFNFPTINNKEIKGSVSLADLNVYSKEEVNSKIGEAATTPDYEILNNKPKINGVELVGNRSLSSLGILSETDIKNLIANTRSIMVVTTMPAKPEKLTLYYIGNKAPYDLKLVDNNGDIIDLGSTNIDLTGYQKEKDPNLPKPDQTVVENINDVYDSLQLILNDLAYGNELYYAQVIKQHGTAAPNNKVLYHDNTDHELYYYKDIKDDPYTLINGDTDIRIIEVANASDIPSSGRQVGDRIMYYVRSEKMLYSYQP